MTTPTASVRTPLAGDNRPLVLSGPATGQLNTDRGARKRPLPGPAVCQESVLRRPVVELVPERIDRGLVGDRRDLGRRGGVRDVALLGPAEDLVLELQLEL